MKKCIVKGCTNNSDQGKFKGNLCMPCYEMLTTGVIKQTNSFLKDLKEPSHLAIVNSTDCVKKTKNGV